MPNFVDLATQTIKDFASTISTAARSEEVKKAYLLGVDQACEILKDFAGNDVVKVILCKDCKFYKPYEVDGTDGECRRGAQRSLCCYDDFCSDAERKTK